jgi:FkbM family methyltransferase
MFIKEMVDRVLSNTEFRLLRESRLGIATGNAYLKRIVEFAGIDFVFDVGANAGQYVDLLRKTVGFKGHILSVEPIPTLAAALEIRAIGDGSWTVLASALDAKSGIAQFNIMKGSQFSSLLAPANDYEGKFQGQHAVAEVIDVPVSTIDEIFSTQQMLHKFSRPLLKLDTQGTELRVLEGSRNVLHNFPVIQTEIGFQSIYSGAAHFQQYLEYFERNNFVLSGLFPNNEGHFPRLLEMDAVFIQRDLLPSLH